MASCPVKGEARGQDAGEKKPLVLRLALARMPPRGAGLLSAALESTSAVEYRRLGSLGRHRSHRHEDVRVVLLLSRGVMRVAGAVQEIHDCELRLPREQPGHCCER